MSAGGPPTKARVRGNKPRSPHPPPANWDIGSGKEATDLTRWVLDVDEGRQTWRYVPASASELSACASDVGCDGSAEDMADAAEAAALGLRVQSVVERHHLGMDTSDELGEASTPPGSPWEAMVRGFDFYSALQTEDGHWAGDYGGPMFLLPGLVIAAYVTGTELGKARKLEMIRYLTNLQVEGEGEGGWGLHIESPSTMFGTALSYVVMRLLGVPAKDKRCARARAWMREHGGATSIPSWGKFWLSVLGVYEWEGLYPVPPELWLLPEWLPIHPHRWWIHCRIVYLPMGWLFAAKARGEITPLVLSLRRELYNQPYHAIDWPAQRGNICEVDVFAPHTTLHKALFKTLVAYEAVHSTELRAAAMDFTYKHIKKEDTASNYIDIGPVNKALNWLCTYFQEGPDSDAFAAHAARVPDYLWLSHDGMKMQGYNGSQLWDTSFALDAFLASPVKERYASVIDKAHEYLDITQVREDVVDGESYYRHISKGAWPFSTRAHGNPIADCTGIALLAVLHIRQLPFLPSPKRISDDRLFDAVNISLSFQNPSGGWATYENKRGPDWVEKLNPSEVFGDIMLDYCYVELTAESMCALKEFSAQFPNHRANEIAAAIKAGGKFIASIQRDDGSWYGSWAVCFTYGTWFGIRGLLAAGKKPTHPRIVKAAKFILSKQNPDGGWGEDFYSCVHKRYIGCESQVTQTAWAVLSLLLAQWPDKAPIEAGIAHLVRKQLPNGNWAQERVMGLFNACAITYTAYPNVFPLWALSEWVSSNPVSKL